MLPKATKVKEFVEQVFTALELIFDAKKFLATIPVDNRAASRLALRLGAKVEGTLTKSCYRNGKMNDVKVYGINK